MEELQELLEKIGEVDPKEFANALKESTPRHYQYIWNGGHKTAFSEAKETIDKLKSEVESFDSERAKLQEKIEALGKEQPDLKAMQERQEQILLAKDKEHKEAIERLKKDADEWRGRYSGRNLEGVVSGVVTDLVSQGVDRDYAIVQTSKPGFRERIRQNDDGEITGALQEDGQTPFPIAEGQTVSTVLARELLQKVPDKFREDRRQQGAGVGDRGGRRKAYTEADLKKLPDKDFEEAVQAIDKGDAQLVAG